MENYLNYIDKFATETDVQTAVDNGELLKPYVAYIEDEDRIDWNSKKIDYYNMPLTIEAISDGEIGIETTSNVKVSYKYIINKEEPVSGSTDSTITVSLKAGDKIKIYGYESNYTYLSIKPSATIIYNIYGNTSSIGLKNSNYENDLTNNPTNGGKLDLKNTKVVDASNLILHSNFYNYHMFSGCTSLTTAPSILPAKSAVDCREMFKGCTSLTTAPALPATTLASNCYQDMFYGCTSLTTAPALPATILTQGCYAGMFYGCTSLATAPALPATTLANGCYRNMFNNCTSLTTAPALPATTLAKECYYYMFQGCTSLQNAPELPATTLADTCYYYMFDRCTSLTTAPELPATTLVNSCYQFMFYRCSSLNYIKCLATDISVSNCTNNWLNGVSSTGTFVKASGVSWETGVSGIPSGWTVQEV